MDTASRLARHSLIVVSNREPYEHINTDAGVTVRIPAGGVVSAIDPLMRGVKGTWVAWGSGGADRDHVDSHDRVAVPPHDPTYTLRRVWLSDADVEGYYLGFANGTLWPVCHMVLQHLEFREEQWQRYIAVNQHFADAVLDEALRARRAPMVWVHDYHLALVPEMLRERMPKLFIHHFWHIPFPPPDVLRLVPVGVYDRLIRSLLGNDLLAFHTARFARNFLDCVAEFIPDAEVDHETLNVYYDGRKIALGIFPLGIDFDQYETLAQAPEAAAFTERVRTTYARRGRLLGVSVDRVDYTKGIPERLRALESMWAETPELRDAISMVFIATPSRMDIPAYQNLGAGVGQRVAQINARFGSGDWTPIVLIEDNLDAATLAGLYRAADFCVVSSLQDGMNLVAKEFVACQIEERGVLVLSRFAGVADEVDGAILINPYNIDGLIGGMLEAVQMPVDERRERMHRMREQFRGATVWRWLDTLLAHAYDLWVLRGADRAPESLDSFANSPSLLDRVSGVPLVLMLDVDGTLAPLAARPEDAEVPESTRRILQALTHCPSVHVVLVSGRAAEDAKRVVGVEGVWVSGIHGIVLHTTHGDIQIDDHATQGQAAIAQAAERLRDELDRFPGVQLEDKRWTLSLHYRRADPVVVPALRALVQRTAHERDLRITEGKGVLEVRPTAPVDKGTAVTHLAAQLGANAFGAAVVFAGDDNTDEDAFRALRARLLRAVTIRLSDDPAPETAAEFVVADIETMQHLLRQLYRMHTDDLSELPPDSIVPVNSTR